MFLVLRNLIIAFLALATMLAYPLPTRANDPLTLNDYALELINRGEYDKALEQLQHAYGLNAYDPVLKKNLAEAYVYVGIGQVVATAAEHDIWLGARERAQKAGKSMGSRSEAVSPG